MEVWGILDYAAANDARKADTDGGDLFSARDFVDLLPDAIHDAFRWHGLQRVQPLRFFRNDADRTEDLVAFHQAEGDMFLPRHAHSPWHVALAESIDS